MVGTNPLPPTVEHRPLDPRLINGVDGIALALGARGDAHVTFVSQSAALRNTVGVYLVGSGGELRDPRILVSDTRALGSGDPITAKLSEVYAPGELHEGQRFGLFLVRDGGAELPEGALEPGRLKLLDLATGKDATAATKADDLALVLDGDPATRIDATVLPTTDGTPDEPLENALHPAEIEHVISAEDGAGALWLGFEDALDFDFNDLVVKVETDPRTKTGELEKMADGRHGVRFDGEKVGDRAGLCTALADVNGDGLADVVIGAPDADPNGSRNAGAVYVFFGTGDDLPAVHDLADLDGENGFALYGAKRGDRLGTAVADAGDTDGDGLADLVIGALGLDAPGAKNAGGAYVVRGSADGWQAAQAISGLGDERHVRIDGAAKGDQAGISVAGGDVDGDGFADVVIGARLAEKEYARYSGGAGYVLFGGEDGVAGGDLGALDGSDGFVLHGSRMFDQAGRTVAGLGDIDGDGYDDIAVGAPDADPQGRTNGGEAYIILGHSDPFPPSLDARDLGDAGSIVIEGASDRDFAGFAIAGAGDVNGDGFDDVLVGAYDATVQGIPRVGAAYVIFGSDTDLPPHLDLADLDGTDGFVIEGVAAKDGAGRAVAGVGDVNGDGFDDIVVGARYADRGDGGEGAAYLIFGHDGGFAARLDAGSLGEDEGCILLGGWRDAYAGFAVSGGGDMNGDGLDDLLIGAPADRDAGQPGSTYLLFGDRNFGEPEPRPLIAHPPAPLPDLA